MRIRVTIQTIVLINEKANKFRRKVKREEFEMRNNYDDIIAKYLSNEELDNEEKKLIDQLKADGVFHRIMDQSSEVFAKTDLYLHLKDFNTDKAWEKVEGQMNQNKKKTFQLSWAYRVAAVFLLLLATTFTFWYLNNGKQSLKEVATSQFDYSNPEIVLPDGSKVRLNHGSKLIYPGKFKGDYREVTLQGEAFFDVAKNPQKPFIIKANGAQVKVLGTSFNVYAYDQSSTIEVIVRTGKVELAEGVNKKEEEKILLMPGEKGTYNKQSKKIVKEAAFDPNNLSWLTHEIEFRYTKLSDVIQTLQRAYNLQITVDEKIDMNQPISATFNEQQPEYIMEVITMTLNLNLKKESDHQYHILN